MSYANRLRFRAVCRQWRVAAQEQHPLLKFRVVCCPRWRAAAALPVMLRQRLARAIQSTMPWWWRDRQSSVSDLVERGSYSTPLGLGEHFVEQLARCKCIRVRVAVGGARELQRECPAQRWWMAMAAATMRSVGITISEHMHKATGDWFCTDSVKKGHRFSPPFYFRCYSKDLLIKQYIVDYTMQLASET
jgi:hypothetical protein